MLQKLNERIQGFISWLVIGLIAVTFTLFGLDYYLQSHQSTESKALVNGIPITNEAFEMNYRRSRAQHDPAKITAESDKRIKQEVLDTIIANEVAVDAARQFGFEVNAEQANSAIVNIPQFQEDGHFSAERYQQALSSAFFTAESFQKEVRQGMLLNQQKFAFMGSAFVLPDELARFVKLYMQTRDYDYLVIPANLFDKNIQITSEEIKRFYEKHQKNFQTPEQITIDYVTLSMPEIRKNIKVTDEEVSNYYQENQNNYLTPAQWQVSHILFAIPENATPEAQNEIKKKAEDAFVALQADPKQFNHWAKTISDDKFSSINNGVLPWIVAGQTSFDTSLTNLTKAGEISAPVRTKDGYEIFKVIDYKPAIIKPFAEVESQIKTQLQTELAQTEYTHLLEQLSDLSYQTPDSLTPVSETLKMPIQQTSFFSRHSGKEEITKNKAVISAAFSHDVLDLGNNSEPVQVDSDSVIVLRVNKHLKSSIKALQEVEPSIKQTLIKDQTRQKAMALGQDYLNNKSDAKKFIDTNSLQWNPVRGVSRDAEVKEPLINELAYTISKSNLKKGQNLPNGDYVLVELKKINTGNIESLDKEQKASLAQQIEANFGMLDYDLYLNKLIKDAKIEKHE